MRVYFLGRANGHRTFVDNNSILAKNRAKVAGYFQDVLQVGRPIFARRGGQGQEDNFCIFDPFFEIRCKYETAFFYVPMEQDFQAWFVDGYNAIV